MMKLSHSEIEEFAKEIEMVNRYYPTYEEFCHQGYIRWFKKKIINGYKTNITHLIKEILSYTSLSFNKPLNRFKFILFRKKSVESIRLLADKINLHLQEIKKLKNDC